MEKIHWIRFAREGPTEKVRRIRSVGEGSPEKVSRRRSAGEGLLGKRDVAGKVGCRKRGPFGKREKWF